MDFFFQFSFVVKEFAFEVRYLTNLRAETNVFKIWVVDEKGKFVIIT